MKHLKLVILAITIILLPGCWNYRELENLAIVGAIGVDIEGNLFNISVEIINPKKVGSSTSGGNTPEETDVVVYQAKAKTIREAIDKIPLESPKALYVGHMNLLVISEEAAKKGIKEFIDYFMRDTESRKVFTTTIVKNGKAIDAIKILQPLETVTSTNIQSSFEAVKKTYGTIRNDSFDQIVMCLYTPGRNPTISVIEIIGPPDNGEKNENLSTTKPDTSIKISNLGILKNDKLIGYISVDEAFYYAMIRGTLSNLSLSFPCDGNDYSNVIIDSMKSNLEMTVKKNKPVASINVTGKAALTEFNCKLDLTKEENIDKIEKMAEKEIKKKLKKVIEKVQNYNSDVFGFGEKLYRNNYKYWVKNKKNWDKIFPKIEANTKVDISVERMSSTINTAKSR